GGDCQAFIAADALITVRDLQNMELDNLDFGVTNIGSPVTQSFTISNDAGSPDPLSFDIIIDNENYRIEPAGSASQQVQPGETVQVSVRYDPQDDRIHDGTVRIRHNASNQASPITVPLLGESLLQDEIARLEQNYPNPFNPETTIPFVLPDQANVRLDIYSIDGRLVKTLQNGTLPSGRYEDPYNLSDLASGMYLYRLIVDNFADTKKFLLVK
ncbi:MAG: T9SS type A sorting domain-containing protein, partial [Balneolaceae bacterium]|nr:T9SS type A sorting domain-containing protein [Balneolaceae bacterium]